MLKLQRTVTDKRVTSKPGRGMVKIPLDLNNRNDQPMLGNGVVCLIACWTEG